MRPSLFLEIRKGIARWEIRHGLKLPSLPSLAHVVAHSLLPFFSTLGRHRATSPSPRALPPLSLFPLGPTRPLGPPLTRARSCPPLSHILTRRIITMELLNDDDASIVPRYAASISLLLPCPAEVDKDQGSVLTPRSIVTPLSPSSPATPQFLSN